ncbi:DUF2075 domain-containing protein [Jatrophihabitans cynanchi]|uniref:DUF2075 domain-containing protein n=1 Tax=Jatrophihabitans cynanchi TaxID=2944128 RepID=A0ABY7K0D9_9ACTN|nr:DNA/RNA helicase domain-containing protein [Jatrophihabitans sp. SB3-54]WAX58314.1 DUF2075 domain-containing protein [Jatrophihabitans sp. SB3-54]
MTSFRIERLNLRDGQLTTWSLLDPRHSNWPVVYTLDGRDEIYVGESLNATARMRQHLDTAAKARLTTARVVIDETFNKSACLDLESFLIRLLAGDGKYEVLNRNEGITNANYFGREDYRKTFDAIFDELREQGIFTRTVRQIQNTDLFKLSPFKALTPDQAGAIEDILNGLFDDLEAGVGSRIVIRGDPGTGKTVVAIFLMKLLSDIRTADTTVPPDTDSILSEFFVPGYPELLAGFRFGLVVPQQSLRRSIQKVFRKTPGLDESMVLTPFQVGESREKFDLLIVDEAHRLNQRANQPSGVQNKKFADINHRLFGRDEPGLTQLDWITTQSNHQIFLLDAAQRVRPADVPVAALDSLVRPADEQHRMYVLTSQMRVQAGADYVGYIRALLTGCAPAPQEFPGYDLRFFDDFAAMQRALRRREQQDGLARLLAGYAWPWRSKRDPSAHDIEIAGVRLQWNRSAVDWVSSATSVDEVGSIHTIQGYDLNYAGVIIGNDLRFDSRNGGLVFNRSSYFDKKGTENNRILGISYDDSDLLQFVTNIYAVLLTRGIRGTYIYVCDPALRDHLRPLFPQPID